MMGKTNRNFILIHYVAKANQIVILQRDKKNWIMSFISSNMIFLDI